MARCQNEVRRYYRTFFRVETLKDYVMSRLTYGAISNTHHRRSDKHFETPMMPGKVPASVE